MNRKHFKIYKVQIQDNECHHGFAYYSNKKAAVKRVAEEGDDAELEEISVQPTKKGIISALNIHGSHPDNG